MLNLEVPFRFSTWVLLSICPYFIGVTMTEKDYIAQLFRVRRERFGISDDIYWGWFNPDDGSVE
tara:strand:+ start:152 stop:343 length:192 start_codon:yes stop_codon:yes gene_type:complete